MIRRLDDFSTCSIEYICESSTDVFAGDVFARDVFTGDFFVRDVFDDVCKSTTSHLFEGLVLWRYTALRRHNRRRGL